MRMRRIFVGKLSASFGGPGSGRYPRGIAAAKKQPVPKKNSSTTEGASGVPKEGEGSLAHQVLQHLQAHGNNNAYSIHNQLGGKTLGGSKEEVESALKSLHQQKLIRGTESKRYEEGNYYEAAPDKAAQQKEKVGKAKEDEVSASRGNYKQFISKYAGLNKQFFTVVKGEPDGAGLGEHADMLTNELFNNHQNPTIPELKKVVGFYDRTIVEAKARGFPAKVIEKMQAIRMKARDTVRDYLHDPKFEASYKDHNVFGVYSPPNTKPGSQPTADVLRSSKYLSGAPKIKGVHIRRK